MNWNEWLEAVRHLPMSQIRCDVPPTVEVRALIEKTGLDEWEAYTLQLERRIVRDHWIWPECPSLPVAITNDMIQDQINRIEDSALVHPTVDYRAMEAELAENCDHLTVEDVRAVGFPTTADTEQDAIALIREAILAAVEPAGMPLDLVVEIDYLD